MRALKVTDESSVRPRLEAGGNCGRRVPIVMLVVAACVALLTGWLGVRGMQARSSLTAAVPQVGRLTNQLTAGDQDGARSSLAGLQGSTQRARERTSDPVWRAAGHLPWIGANLSAVATVAATLDGVADSVLPLVVTSAGALDPAALVPVDGQFDLDPIESAAPTLTQAATAMAPLEARLSAVRTDDLLSVVATPVGEAQGRLHDLAAKLQAAQVAATLLPPMLGASGPRSYLVMLQTNAELRATGGMPGALTLLTADDGRIVLTRQSSAVAVYRSGVDPVALTASDEAMYSDRMGTYMADVNFTPDFPTAAGLGAQMWQQYTGDTVDGVIATDPVALSYLLAATGPVDDGTGGQLRAADAVDTLLSGVYARFPEPADQDAYFATVAANVFTALVDGRARPPVMVSALARAAGEHRLLVWSNAPDEQSVLARTGLGGAMTAQSSGQAAAAASPVGVFFNDGTGSKMDYYLDTRVSVASDCSQTEGAADGAVRTVQVTLANNAPADAARTLSASITGTGSYGAARGQIETSVVIVGPNGGSITAVRRDGRLIGVEAHEQSGRSATVVSVLLSPGESAALDVTMLDPAGTSPVQLWSTPTRDQPGFRTGVGCE